VEGNNIDIKAALAEGADYVWLLNNDIALARADVGVVGPKSTFLAARHSLVCRLGFPPVFRLINYDGLWPEEDGRT